MAVSRITDSTYLIDTKALGQTGTVAVYVLKGEKVALVDCGYASSYRTVLDDLSQIGIRRSDVRYIIPTHVHLDHAGATGHLLKEMPNAQVMAHERAVPHLVDPSRLIQSATSIFGERLIQAYGFPLPVDQGRITPVGQEAHLELGGLSLTAVYAPGHAPHQIAVFVQEEMLLLSADSVGIVYPSIPTMIPTTPPPSLDPVKLSETVDKLAQMGARKLLVPHFGIRDDVLAVFETTKKKTEAWLTEVGTMRKKNGAGVENIVKRLESEVVTDARLARSSLPPFAQLSVRITVMGMLHYLEKESAR